MAAAAAQEHSTGPGEHDAPHATVELPDASADGISHAQAGLPYWLAIQALTARVKRTRLRALSEFADTRSLTPPTAIIGGAVLRPSPGTRRRALSFAGLSSGPFPRAEFVNRIAAEKPPRPAAYPLSSRRRILPTLRLRQLGAELDVARPLVAGEVLLAEAARSSAVSAGSFLTTNSFGTSPECSSGTPIAAHLEHARMASRPRPRPRSG